MLAAVTSHPFQNSLLLERLLMAGGGQWGGPWGGGCSPPPPSLRRQYWALNLSSSLPPHAQLLGLASLMQRPDQSLAVQTILNMPRNISSSCGVLTLTCVLPARRHVTSQSLCPHLEGPTS